MSADGSKALIYVYNTDKKLTLSPIGLEGNEQLIGNTALLADLETGETEVLPLSPSSENARDVEFSSDGKSIYLLKSLGITRLDLVSKEESYISTGLRSLSHIKVASRENDSDLLLHFSGRSLHIFDSANGEALGILDDVVSQFSVSPIDGSFLVADIFGKAKRVAIRQGQLITTSINPTLAGFDLKSQSKNGYFYKIQTSRNLTQWVYEDGSVLGDGSLISFPFPEFSGSRQFGRIIEFPIGLEN